MTEVCRVTLKEDTQARSVLLQALAGVPFLLVGTADGYFVSHQLASGTDTVLSLVEPKKVRWRSGGGCGTVGRCVPPPLSALPRRCPWAPSPSCWRRSAPTAR